MRTTLTLDADVARSIKAAVRRRGATFKTVVNSALRVGLGLAPTRASQVPFVVEPHSGGFMPGVDPHKLNKLAAELEDDRILAKATRP